MCPRNIGVPQILVNAMQMEVWKCHFCKIQLKIILQVSVAIVAQTQADFKNENGEKLGLN